MPQDPNRWACSRGHIHKNQKQADACEFSVRINTLVEKLERAISNAENPPPVGKLLPIRGIELGNLFDDWNGFHIGE